MLKELRQTEEARSKFLMSCQLTPLLWAAWLELATGCTDREEVSGKEKHIVSVSVQYIIYSTPQHDVVLYRLLVELN